MNNLGSFIFSCWNYIYYLIPFLDSISGYILTWIEAKKAIQTAKIYQIKQEIKAAELDEPKTAIGFIYQEEEEEE